MPRLLATVLIVVGVLRMATTWRVFSDTVDEATHVGAGLELLQYHHYDLQPENPPLPRIILAAIPAASGIRWNDEAPRPLQIHGVMYGHGEYRRNLVYIRAGNIVFFVLASIALFVWVRRELGDAEALLALLLFTTQPVILGYSGLATFDAAATAGMAVALVAFSAWLKNPDVRRAAILGAAYAASILFKFSSIGYVPAVCLAIYIVRWLHERRPLRELATLLVIPFVAFAVIWAGYGFTVGTVGDLGDRFQKQLGVLFSHLPSSMPLPAANFFRGIGGLLEIDRGGFESYFLGKVSHTGWRWYFPAAVALKSTLPFLALIVAGFVAAWKTRRWPMLEALAASAAILALAAPSHLDLGVRYVLPVYVPLSAAAAIGAMALLQLAKRLAIVLIALHVVASFGAHPDYFPYFNEIASDDPGHYLVDSNLDWGQDVLRLRHVLRQAHVEQIALNLGYFDYDALGFPKHSLVVPLQPESGWIATSEHVYRVERAKGGWSWLDPYEMRRIGKSIRLYYVPPCPAPTQ